MKILISGAGIGGLTAGLCLLDAGYEVEIFEQAAELNEIGAGLQLGANAVRVLDYLGLADELKKVIVQPDAIEMRTFDTSELLFREELGTEYQQQFAAPYYHIHRADLHSILTMAFEQRAPNRLHLGFAVTEYKDAGDEVIISTGKGDTYRGDVLVGADGVNSGVLQQLFGKLPANWTGNVAWRGTVDAAKLPDDFMDKVVTNFIGPRKHMVIYYLRDQQLVNFVGVVENETWQEESWTVNSPWEELKSDYSGWNETVQTLIDAMDKDQCYRWALFNREPMNNWSSERVTLLGDAAHASLPFLASGAAMAIEDARVLARALQQADSAQLGLQLYQRSRLHRTSRVQETSVSMGKLYHLPNRLALKAAFTAAKFVERPTTWLAEYDANTVELI